MATHPAPSLSPVAPPPPAPNLNEHQQQHRVEAEDPWRQVSPVTVQIMDVIMEGGGLDSAAVPLQLLNQTSHLTLSISGKDEPGRSSVRGATSTLSASPYLLPETLEPQGSLLPPLASDFQPLCPEIGRGQENQPELDGQRDTRMAALSEEPPAAVVGSTTTEGPAAAAVVPPTLIPDLVMAESPAWTRSSVDDVREDGLQEQGGTVVNSLKNSSDMMLLHLPTEVLLQILGHLDVCDLLATSRTSHHLRDLSLAPILHLLRLRRTRAILPPMLTSPSRPSLSDLMRRSIFLTHTTVVSRRLARSLVAIRLSRRLAARPSAEVLVERAVLPPECLPCMMVAPGLVARKRAVERERVKDGLRRWIGSVWRGEVDKREQGVRVWEERVGVGRVWRLRRFWERVGGDV